MLTVTTTSTGYALTTMASIKAHLGLTTTEDDDLLRTHIAAATDAIAKELGYWPLRQRYTETVPGHGHLRLMLSQTPVRAVSSVAMDTQTVAASSYSLENPGAGIIYRELGWPWTAGVEWDLDAHIQPKSERPKFSVDYEAGWVFTTSTGSLDADGFITSSGGNTLPADIEHAALETAKSFYLGRKRDRKITSKKVGDLAITYGGQETALPPEAIGLLERWRRYK